MLTAVRQPPVCDTSGLLEHDNGCCCCVRRRLCGAAASSATSAQIGIQWGGGEESDAAPFRQGLGGAASSFPRRRAQQQRDGEARNGAATCVASPRRRGEALCGWTGWETEGLEDRRRKFKNDEAGWGVRPHHQRWMRLHADYVEGGRGEGIETAGRDSIFERNERERSGIVG